MESTNVFLELCRDDEPRYDEGARFRTWVRAFELFPGFLAAAPPVLLAGLLCRLLEPEGVARSPGLFLECLKNAQPFGAETVEQLGIAICKNCWHEGTSVDALRLLETRRAPAAEVAAWLVDGSLGNHDPWIKKFEFYTVEPGLAQKDPAPPIVEFLSAERLRLLAAESGFGNRVVCEKLDQRIEEGLRWRGGLRSAWVGTVVRGGLR